MLRRPRKTVRLNEWRGIDQFVRLNSRGPAKESIHEGEPDSGAKSRESSGRHAEIREQPGRIRSGRACEFLDDERQLRFAKAIENEMGDDQVVAILRWAPRGDVIVEKTNARDAIGRCLFDAFARQLQYSFARVEAIHFDGWMAPKQFTEESSVPLTYNERAARDGDFRETGNATPLELVAEGDPFQRSIPRRDGIEAHALAPISTTSGVSRTRSARAVR